MGGARRDGLAKDAAEFGRCVRRVEQHRSPSRRRTAAAQLIFEAQGESGRRVPAPISTSRIEADKLSTGPMALRTGRTEFPAASSAPSKGKRNLHLSCVQSFRSALRPSSAQNTRGLILNGTGFFHPAMIRSNFRLQSPRSQNYRTLTCGMQRPSVIDHLKTKGQSGFWRNG